MDERLPKLLKKQTDHLLMNKFELLYNFRAPKAYDDGGHTGQKYYVFKKGTKVSGNEQRVEGMAPYIMVNANGDDYVIPLKQVRKIGGQMHNAEGSQQERLTKEELPDGIAKRIRNIQDGTYTSKNVNKTKGAVNGILIGGAIGGAYGAFKGKPILVYALIGTVIGGFAGRMISPLLQKTSQEKKEEH